MAKPTTTDAATDANRSASADTHRGEFKEQANRVKEDAGELLRLAGVAARDEFARMKTAASDGLASGRERVSKLGEKLDERVADRPRVALLVAVGFGLLLGLYFKRKR
jgi:ElaB/YqjD/DUF883 family membrane-anchored ribosome-binding protein